MHWKCTLRLTDACENLVKSRFYNVSIETKYTGFDNNSDIRRRYL